jgi:hypothetical protein
MKKLSIVFLAVTVLLAGPALARGGGGHSGGGHSSSYHSSSRSPRVSGGEHYVRSYTRKNGTAVSGHYQTNPNQTRNDNYSTRGNINPHTGKLGTKPRDGE